MPKTIKKATAAVTKALASAVTKGPAKAKAPKAAKAHGPRTPGSPAKAPKAPKAVKADKAHEAASAAAEAPTPAKAPELAPAQPEALGPDPVAAILERVTGLLGEGPGGLTAIEAALREAFEAGRLAIRERKPREPREGNKRDLCAALLQREDGVTTRELLDATGWPAISVPAVAKASGLTLRKEKREGQPTLYFGTPRA